MAKKIFKIILYCIPVGVIIFYLVTSYSMRLPAEMKKYYWTESNLALYEKDGKDIDIRTGTTYDGYMTDDGYFGIFSVQYTPGADQFQCTVRYNRSTVTKVNAAFENEGKNLLPEGMPFSAALYSEKQNKFFTEYLYKNAESSRHLFYRYVFEGVEIEENDRVWIYLYPSDNVDTSASPVGKLLLYESEYGTDEYKLRDSSPSLTEGLTEVTLDGKNAKAG